MKRASGLLTAPLLALVWLALVWVAPAAPASAPAAPASTSAPGIAYVTAGGNGLPSVWVAGASGGGARRLATGSAPLLSPNGLTVAVTDQGSAGPALTLYPTNGGAATSYFDIAQTSANAVAWSPDSRYVAINLADVNLPSPSGSGLEVIDTMTGTTTMVAQGVIYGASFAPGTSDALAFARAPSLRATAPTNIFTVSAGGTGLKQITTDGVSSNPIWGTRGIAFDRARLRKNVYPLDQIWLMRADGRHRRQITHVRVGPLVEGLVPLAVSADGTRLAAEFEGEDTGIGYGVSLLSGRARQLKVGRAAVSAWGISRDGRSILISVGGFMAPASRARIERIPFSGGRPTSLIAHGNNPSWDQ